MQIVVSEFNEHALRLALAGDLDITAAEHLGLPLAALAGSGGGVVVDMRNLDSIASIGIRHLVFAARTLGRGRGQLILLSPNPDVTNALKTARVNDLLPIVGSEDEARARLKACPSKAGHSPISGEINAPELDQRRSVSRSRTPTFQSRKR